MINEPETIQLRTQGICCRMIQVTIQDNKILSAEFFGGCNGNLQGISKLIKGMDIDAVIEKLKGIQCGDKPTSCPDQLAQGLALYKSSKQKTSV